jgi:hypothetical protein
LRVVRSSVDLNRPPVCGPTHATPSGPGSPPHRLHVASPRKLTDAASISHRAAHNSRRVETAHRVDSGARIKGRVQPVPVAFGIASVMALVVVRKAREIAILRAMDISQSKIMRLFLHKTTEVVDGRVAG